MKYANFVYTDPVSHNPIVLVIKKILLNDTLTVLRGTSDNMPLATQEFKSLLANGMNAGTHLPPEQCQEMYTHLMEAISRASKVVLAGIYENGNYAGGIFGDVHLATLQLATYFGRACAKNVTVTIAEPTVVDELPLDYYICVGIPE